MEGVFLECLIIKNIQPNLSKDMKRSLNLICISCILLLFSILSCKTEVLEILNEPILKESAARQYEIVDGIAPFPDHNSFINTVNDLGKLSMKERAMFCQKQGFKSFLSYYAQETKKYADMDSVSQRNVQHAAGNKYMLFKDGVPSLNFVNPLIASVADENGLLFVGKSVMRFIGNKEIVVKNGDIAQAMGSFVPADSNVAVFNTEISKLNGSANARAMSACPRLYGQVGSFALWGDGSKVETTARVVPVSLNAGDQYKVYFFVKTEGTFVNRGWLDGNSDNNTLKDVYTCDVYNSNNNVVAIRSLEHYSTSTGHSIIHEDAGIDAGQCYSFQVSYYYVSFRQGTINPLPGTPCSISNCINSYPIYINDKHTVNTSCAN